MSHIVIGTPMYGGACLGRHAASIALLTTSLKAIAHKVSRIAPGNESLIPCARDAIAWHFLSRNDATHLLFIDADEVVRPADIVKMIEADKDILVGPVPAKTINWRRVAEAAKNGVPPELLHLYSGVFNLSFMPGSHVGSITEPFEVRYGGAGLMLVKRRVFEILAGQGLETYHALSGRPIPPGGMKHFFPIPIVDGELLPEDFGFCHLWREAGGTIWCAPWVEVEHMGTYSFNGSFSSAYAIAEPVTKFSAARQPSPSGLILPA